MVSVTSVSGDILISSHFPTFRSTSDAFSASRDTSPYSIKSDSRRTFRLRPGIVE